MASGDPLDVIAHVSGLVAVVDPRDRNPFDDKPHPLPSLDELVQSFVDVKRVETSALLLVIEALTTDETLRRLIGREVDERRDPLPGWLTHLGAVEAVRAAETVHPLGDGENVAVTVRLTDGSELTALVYVAHNLGSIVKDGFVVSESIDDLIAMLRPDADDPDVQWRDIR